MSIEANLEQLKPQETENQKVSNPLIDPFARRVTYLRVSVTDRCDFRCVYCMAEDMTFLPKSQVLSLEELERLSRAFIARGVKKIRLTGGEPLVRKGVMQLVNNLGECIGDGGLDELTLTTNGSQLSRYAEALYKAGVRRINVSVDTLDADLFARITRGGSLPKVIDGLKAAKAAGLGVKINTVALRGVNEDGLDGMIEWCGRQGYDMTLIETMPLGDIEGDRTDQYLPLSLVRSRLAQRWTLEDIPFRTGGPARYTQIAETGRKLGFITPLTHNFCESCNRVRLTCTGELYMCLGQEDKKDFRALLRQGCTEEELQEAITDAIRHKPKGHDFIIDRDHKRPAVNRHMSMTGG
jgi:cyclic pyranopterin phosphate synthase